MKKNFVTDDLKAWLKDHHQTNISIVLCHVFLTWSLIGLSIWFGLEHSNPRHV